MATTLKDIIVKIRKQKHCFCCFRTFEVGTRMNYWVGVVEGDFNYAYSCLTCQEIMQLNKEDYYPEGYVAEMMEENIIPENYLESLKLNKS